MCRVTNMESHASERVTVCVVNAKAPLAQHRLASAQLRPVAEFPFRAHAFLSAAAGSANDDGQEAIAALLQCITQALRFKSIAEDLAPRREVALVAEASHQSDNDESGTADEVVDEWAQRLRLSEARAALVRFTLMRSLFCFVGEPSFAAQCAAREELLQRLRGAAAACCVTTRGSVLEADVLRAFEVRDDVASRPLLAHKVFSVPPASAVCATPVAAKPLQLAKGRASDVAALHSSTAVIRSSSPITPASTCRRAYFVTTGTSGLLV